MTIDEHKQMDRIVLEEVNVKNFDRVLGEGVTLRFDGYEYFWLVAGERREVKSIPKLKILLSSL